MSDVSALLRVRPGFDLAAVDPRATPGLPGGRAVARDPKAWARAELTELNRRLAVRQEMLFAGAKRDPADRRRVLLVLQSMDCGGKDGTIKKVVGGLDPQGVSVVAFGPPTEAEQAHDFLWRVRRALPRPGHVGVFNRSHYEDVLVARVRGLVPEPVWRNRYQMINDFEAEITSSGVSLIKVMLHISFQEQRKRLLDRLADPAKHWKYDPRDVADRALWPAYQAAYQEALARCSSDAAPWYVVPADRKWYRNWAVAHLMLDAFSGLDLRYPDAEFDPGLERERLDEGTHT